MEPVTDNHPTEATVGKDSPDTLPQATPTPPEANEQKKRKDGLLLGFLLFALAVLALGEFVPNGIKALSTSSSHPGLVGLLLAGTAMILVTSVLLSVIQSKFRMGAGWLLATLSYAAIIVALKFVVAPTALYGQVFNYGPGAGTNFDPNSSSTTIWYSAIVLAMYMIVIYTLYRLAQTKLPPELRLQKAKHTNSRGIILFGALAGVGLLAVSGYWVLPLLLFPSLSDSVTHYISAIAQNYGVILGVGIIGALAAGYYSFNIAVKEAAVRRDATILAICFWVSLCLIITYSVAGAIFVAALAKLWPFNSVYVPLSSSGK
jgi:hypothetical protein